MLLHIHAVNIRSARGNSLKRHRQTGDPACKQPTKTLLILPRLFLCSNTSNTSNTRGAKSCRIGAFDCAAPLHAWCPVIEPDTLTASTFSLRLALNLHPLLAMTTYCSHAPLYRIFNAFIKHHHSPPQTPLVMHLSINWLHMSSHHCMHADFWPTKEDDPHLSVHILAWQITAVAITAVAITAVSITAVSITAQSSQTRRRDTKTCIHNMTTHH